MDNKKSIAKETGDTNFKAKGQQCDSHNNTDKSNIKTIQAAQSPPETYKLRYIRQHVKGQLLRLI